jgi:hypothetical protein
MNIQGKQFFSLLILQREKSTNSCCVHLLERWPFPYIINLHEILMEVTVATKHLKILKMPAKVVLDIPSLPLGLFCQLLIAIFLNF